jgi:carboxyl-terminal processing protease
MRCRNLRAVAGAALALAALGARADAPPSWQEALASLQAAYAAAVSPGEQADFYRELFVPVFERIERSYATEVDFGALARTARAALQGLPPAAADPREAFSRAANAALRQLDPYSRYLDARGQADAREPQRGSFSGVGLQVEPGEGAVRVVAPLPGSPAARAGLRAGDLIVRVDDLPLLNVPLAEAIAKMRGAPGTSVSMTVRRSGADEFTVSLTRETIRSQAVVWSMEGEVLVLRLAVFSFTASTALQQAIAEATAAHAPAAVVLDLRGNPGGLLQEAIRTADLFLAQGEIATLRGRAASHRRTWQADADEVLPGLPMVVLLDRRSASASELVAASLQDNRRATVMGQRSFGKGTVQTTYALGEEVRGLLKLTSAVYHRPAGGVVQGTGVAPDVELLALAPAGEAPDASSAHAPPARIEQGRCSAAHPAPDPALACAVVYLQSGSIHRFIGRLADLPR